MPRFYLSNIRPAWPIDRQEAALDATCPGWRRCSVYRDVLTASARKSHGAVDLVARARLLRPTSRTTPETVTVAGLAVLAWAPGDFVTVLAALSSRGASLVSIDDGMTVAPNDVQATADAVAAFERAILRVGGAGKSGGQVSGEIRSARAKAAIEVLRPFWGMPSDTHPTPIILRQCGVSKPTAIKYLGYRLDAQRAYQRAQDLAERNKQRAKGNDHAQT